MFQITKLKTAFWLVPGVMLVLAPLGWPYGYYSILRVVVTVCAVFLTLRAREQKQQYWPWLFAGVALLFNPINPLGIGRELWGPIDLLCAVMFVLHWRTQGAVSEGQRPTS